MNDFFQDLRVFACGSCFFAAAAAQSKPAMGLLPHFARRVFPSAADDNLAGRSADLPAAFRKGVISCMDHFKKRDTCCGAERRWSWHCCCARPCRRALRCDGRRRGPGHLRPDAGPRGPHGGHQALCPRGDGGEGAGEWHAADDCGLQTGDIIVKCGGVSVTSSEQFQSLLQENGETATDLQVRREGGSVTLSVSPEQNEKGAYCIGAWIRDSMAGIGTMTYYDPESGAFGALGHGITDADTALLMPFASGSILPSTVKAVKKGAIGEAGELRGDFDLATDLGDLYANTTSGVFGTLDPGEFTERLGDPMPVAAAGEVHAGPATILSNVEGDAVQEYDVEILQVVENAADGRDLVISVTDPELLAATGGIVQGMSGSPILQDGKFAGAVTHVLLNDPSKGYGILMETMLAAGDFSEEPVA